MGLRRSVVLALACAVAAAGGLVALGAGREPARAGCGLWRIDAMPPSPEADRFLFGVGASSESDAWAVGSTRSPGGAARALALHWDGERWRAVATPSAGPGDQFLNAVAVVSPSDAWAAGFWRGSDDVASTLVMHWDGRRWSIVESPNPGDGEHILASASAGASSDVWFAGTSRIGSSFRSLILHWDGAGLTATYPSRDVAPAGEAIGAVSSAGSIALAVGGRALENGGTEPLVLRWDGSAWHDDGVGLAAEHGAILGGVAASPSGKAWAVGSYPGIGTTAGFAAGFDGSRWTTFRRRSLGTGDSLSGVAAFDGGAWAVGSYVEDRIERTLIERGADGGWRRVSSPNATDRDNHLLDVAALPTGEAWAVGSTTDAGHREHPLIQHFCPA
ncbi:MAG TPA: hypothetical protein VGK12_00040 [Actinomycetota bacterium]